MRVLVDRRSPSNEFFSRVQRAAQDVQRFQYSSLSEIRGWCGLSGGEPLFRSLVAFHNRGILAPALSTGEGLSIRPVAAEERPGFPLTLVASHRDELRLGLRFEREWLTEPEAGRLLGCVTRLLEGVMARLGELDLLGAEERHRVLAGWNQTQAGQAGQRCLHEQCAGQARRTPGAVAVAAGQQQVSYAALASRVNALAGRLTQLGVGPEVLIGVCVQRGLRTLECLLAILQAGGAYLPLDPSYLRQRLAWMLADSQARLVLLDDGLQQRLPLGPGSWCRTAPLRFSSSVRICRFWQSRPGYCAGSPRQVESPQGWAQIRTLECWCWKQSSRGQ